MTSFDDSSEPPDASTAQGHETDDCGCECSEQKATTETTGVETDALELSVPEMDCPSCAEKVENALDQTDGVTEIETRPATGTVLVETSGSVRVKRLIEAVGDAGYEAETKDQTDAVAASGSVWHSRRALKTWASGVFVGGGLLIEFVLTGQNLTVGSVAGTTFQAADLLFVIAVAVGGQEILENGVRSVRQLSLDIDFLVSTAILGALTASLLFDETLYFEAGTLAFLFSVAELLEQYSVDRARHSLQELIDLSPDTATIKRDGETETVPVEEVEVGDLIAVRPGEKIPMDGVVREGDSAVNQAPITGESVPVDRSPGEEVFAGTINEEGYLEIEVTSRAGEDTLSQIIEMVEDAQSNKTEREQFVERFSSYYTPIIVGFAVLTALLSPAVLGTSWERSFVHGLTLLVLACPCAFVISTPVSVVSGITSAAKNGVLIKGGNHLEAMGEVDVVAFDKTGTLTKGELTVTDVIPLQGNSREELLERASGLEQRSEHPIGEAVLTAAASEGLQTPEITEFESITGKGVRARLDGREYYAGKPALFEELGVDLTHVHATTDGGVVTQTATQHCEQRNCLDLIGETVPELQSAGKTVMLVGTDQELAGVIAVADEIRPETAATIERLKEMGIERTVMLTGDNERTARAIANDAGIDEHHAELLPDQKVEQIERLRENTTGVAMVGDGINDAPALASATVGVAMGAAGTDTALETADIALMSDNLEALPYLYRLSNDANSVIRQNIWSSLAVKVCLALAVPFHLVPIWLAVLAGDAGMTTAVTRNAMRLSRIAPLVEAEKA